MLTISELNTLAPFDFVRVLGSVFEHSPWIAGEAELQRPFANLRTLHAAMTGIVNRSPLEKQLALIRAHPDLAGRMALTAESQNEQHSAGLVDADPQVLARIRELNTAYRTKFGFPFIICARLSNVSTILSAMEERLHHSTEQEIATALEEIGKIALFRLEDLVR